LKETAVFVVAKYLERQEKEGKRERTEGCRKESVYQDKNEKVQQRLASKTPHLSYQTYV
jgi:hypothetical protein